MIRESLALAAAVVSKFPTRTELQRQSDRVYRSAQKVRNVRRRLSRSKPGSKHARDLRALLAVDEADLKIETRILDRMLGGKE